MAANYQAGNHERVLIMMFDLPFVNPDLRHAAQLMAAHSAEQDLSAFKDNPTAPGKPPDDRAGGGQRAVAVIAVRNDDKANIRRLCRVRIGV